MFTGIVRHVGTVVDVRGGGDGRTLRIDLGPLCEGLGEGDSVAVNGLCLTARTIAPPTADFDVVAESLARSTLGDLRPGERVNLERALRVDGRLDGHFVQGHIDGTSEVRSVKTEGRGQVVEFSAPREWAAQMVPKGSIAIDGVSLTLAGVSPEGFSVSLIPATLSATTLADFRAGRKVNVELDLLGKYVRKAIETSVGQNSSTLSLEKLRQAGFA